MATTVSKSLSKDEMPVTGNFRKDSRIFILIGENLSNIYLFCVRNFPIPWRQNSKKGIFPDFIKFIVHWRKLSTDNYRQVEKHMPPRFYDYGAVKDYLIDKAPACSIREAGDQN